MDLFSGKPGVKIDDARTKYQRSSSRLHKIHNEYVVAVNEVRLYQESYLSNVLPSLLAYQQWVQEYLVKE